MENVINALNGFLARDISDLTFDDLLGIVMAVVMLAVLAGVVAVVGFMAWALVSILSAGGIAALGFFAVVGGVLASMAPEMF